MSPSISAIVVVRDGEAYVGEAIESILSQSRAPDEVVVVDDGSIDRSAAVAASFGSRVRLLLQSHAGEAAARNAGLNAASGDLVAFLDADDLWLPDKLERQLRHLDERPELEISLTRFENFWAPGLEAEAERYREHPLAGPLGAYHLGTALIRRRCFEAYGVFDTSKRRVCAMVWFLHAVGRGAALETLAEVLMRRRYHKSNNTRVHDAEFRAAFLHVVKAWLDAKRRRCRDAPTPA